MFNAVIGSFCKATNAITCGCTDDSRLALSVFSFCLVLLALILGIVACFGLSASPDVIAALPWMTYDVDDIMFDDNTQKFYGTTIHVYANLWGIVDSATLDALSWRDIQELGNHKAASCADSSWSMLIRLPGIEGRVRRVL